MDNLWITLGDRGINKSISLETLCLGDQIILVCGFGGGGFARHGLTGFGCQDGREPHFSRLVTDGLGGKRSGGAAPSWR